MGTYSFVLSLAIPKCMPPNTPPLPTFFSQSISPFNGFNLKTQPDPATKIFGLFRSEAGEELVLQKNFFVERILLADSSTG